MTAQTLAPNDITSARILSSFSCVSTSISSFLLLVLGSTNRWTKNFFSRTAAPPQHECKTKNTRSARTSQQLWLCATLRGIMKTYDFHSGCNVQGVAPHVRLPVLILRRGSAVDFCRADTAPCWATVKQQLRQSSSELRFVFVRGGSSWLVFHVCCEISCEIVLQHQSCDPGVIQRCNPVFLNVLN